MTRTTVLPPPSRRAALAGLAALGGGLAAPRIARAAVVNLVVIGKDGWLFPTWDEVARVDLALHRRTAAFINETVGILKAGRMETVISLTPAKARLYRDFLPDDMRVSAEVGRRYANGLEELRKPGTLVPDLNALFTGLRRSAPNEPLFFKADTHWTAFAAEATATEIAKQVKERFRLPASPRPGIQLGAPVEMQHPVGDLAQRLPPPDRANYPPQPYKVRQPQAGEAAALVEEDVADVAVVGNSWMQPRYNFEPMLSNQLGRPVSLTWKIHAYGPYATLLEYLKGEAFRRQRPRVLVWNFHELDLKDLPSAGSWGENAMSPPAFQAEVRRLVA